MLRTVTVLLLLSVLCVPSALAEEFKGVTFAPPTGWAAAEQNELLVLAPANADEQTMVVVVMSGASALGSRSLGAWFEQQMAANLSPQARVLNPGEIQAGSGNGLSTLTNVRAVQDAEGAVRLQMFHAVSDGRVAGLAMAIAASEAAVNQHSAALQALLESMRVGSPGAGKSPAGAPATKQPPAASPPPSRGGEPLPPAAIVGGRPQGLFVGVSMLSGNPVFLLFLSGGRVYHNMPRGGMNRVDWNALQAENPQACGSWSMAGASLRIQWNDGNVWEGPMQLTETGILFQGKRYGRSFPVTQEEMVGSWEGARGTGWLSRGAPASSAASTTMISELSVDAAGNFALGSTLASSVPGASAYGESGGRGRLTIEGYDAIFHNSDGSATRASLVRLRDGGVFILDGTFFMRR